MRITAVLTPSSKAGPPGGSAEKGKTWQVWAVVAPGPGQERREECLRSGRRRGGVVWWMMEAGGVTSAFGFGVWSLRHPKPCWQVSLSGPKTQAPSKRDKQEPTEHPSSACGTRSQEPPVSLENRTGAVLPPPRGQPFGVKEACAGCRQKRGLKTSEEDGASRTTETRFPVLMLPT